MERDTTRLDTLTRALVHSKLEALCCRLPQNVLLLTGYWPMLGTAIALLTRAGTLTLIVPEDERDLARRGWVAEEWILGFAPATLDHLDDSDTAARPLLAEAAGRMGLDRASIGYEGGENSTPAPYVALVTHGRERLALYKAAIPEATFLDATALLADQRAHLTGREIAATGRACAVAELAFRSAHAALRPGVTEAQIAAAAQGELEGSGLQIAGTQRAGGRAFCMSGPRSAEAYRAYALTSNRTLQQGDFVLVHINSYVDGFWTDLTRTYFLGVPSGRQLAMYEAVLEARLRALHTLGAGVRAATVDAAARDRLTAAGFGAAFKHQLGHGVGYGAIYYNDPPRLHPCSEDILRENMVCNLEPAIYLTDFGGLRHCDMVAVLHEGFQLLSPFHSSLAELLITD